MEKEGKGLVEATFRSGTYAFTTDSDNLTGLHLRRIATGDQRWCRLRLAAVGTGVMSGIVTATLLVIFFVPVFFVVVRRRFDKKSHQDELKHEHPVDNPPPLL